MNWRRPRVPLEAIFLALFVLYPLIPRLQQTLGIGGQLTDIFIYSIVVLGLNVVVGYAGLVHLGIAAFFGIGAYVTGILTFTLYPFHFSYPVALLASALGAGAVGLLLAAPTLRLRGDYLALVTLGFGEVVRFSLQNLDQITGGTKTLSPLPPPTLPGWISTALGDAAPSPNWVADYRWYYFLSLTILVLVYLALRNLEFSRLGRAWMAIREDELAATCMGINAVRAKLSAFAIGSALAGLAGSLYAVKLSSTAQPDTFDFNRSVILLCCVILGGLGSLRGSILGVMLLIGLDSILAPRFDSWLQTQFRSGNPLLSFSNWRLAIFGLALILMIRFRPEGLLPSKAVQEELHHAHAPREGT